jgi:hypothetical protein
MGSQTSGQTTTGSVCRRAAWACSMWVGVVVGSAFAATRGGDSPTNIERAVREAWGRYGQGGITELEIAVKACYARASATSASHARGVVGHGQVARLSSEVQFCTGLDWSAYLIDDAFAQGHRFDPRPYFVKQVAEQRIREQIKQVLSESGEQVLFQKELDQKVRVALGRLVLRGEK